MWRLILVWESSSVLDSVFFFFFARIGELLASDPFLMCVDVLLLLGMLSPCRTEINKNHDLYIYMQGFLRLSA